MESDQETLFEFPCRFPIKVMGKAESNFDALVVGIVRKHAPDLADIAVNSRLSRGGRYISVTIVIQAQNKQQLDDIYMDLTANEKVLMAL